MSDRDTFASSTESFGGVIVVMGSCRIVPLRVVDGLRASNITTGVREE